MGLSSTIIYTSESIHTETVSFVDENISLYQQSLTSSLSIAMEIRVFNNVERSRTELFLKILAVPFQVTMMARFHHNNNFP